VAGTDIGKLAAALLIGAALAFPAGMLVAGWTRAPERDRPAARRAAPVRDVFSPALRRDPYFVDRQRQGVEALEDYCARTGASCAEARAARRQLEKLEAAN